MARICAYTMIFIIALLWTGTAIPTEDGVKSLGDYGFQHDKLHKQGVIQNLIKRSGENCCDGGDGGECRVTRIHLTGVGAKAILNGKWCPVTVRIRTDIGLPMDVFAVVCASKEDDPNTGCPTTYCAAMTPGT